MRILFCNIGWMKYYNGQNDNDRLLNGGKWVKENQEGGEIYNFRNLNGYYYGYVGYIENMRIERLQGVTKKDTEVEDVLVVWVAKDNKQKNKIIGWYKNATVYRKYDSFSINNLDKDEVFYRIKANVFDSTLLPILERKFEIPRASVAKDGVGMGQSNIWYADEEKSELFVKEVIDYIEGYSGEKLNKIGEKNRLELRCSEDDEEVVFYLDKVDELMNEENALEAITFANKLLDKNHDSVNGNNYKGIILSKLGFYDEAIKYFKIASELNEEFANPIFNIGKALSYKGNFKDAIKYIDRYIKLEPEDVEGYEYKGLSLFYMREFKKAKDSFEKACKLEPTDEWYGYLYDLSEENIKVQNSI